MSDGPPAPDADTCDVLVVGAGPAGIAAAIHLHWAGRKVRVFDKARFPRDKCCGDGLTTLALRELEQIQFYPRTVPSWRPLDGATLFAPSGKAVKISLPPDTEGEYAAVAPRFELDNALVAHARSIGVEIIEGHTIESVQQEKDFVGATFAPVGAETASRDRGAPAQRGTAIRVRARYLVGADGAWSPVRKLVGATLNRYRGDWQAMRQYVDGVEGQAGSEMLIWFEPDLLPGYVWSFPLPDGRANLGFGVLKLQGRSGAEVAHLWESLLDRPHIRAAFGASARLIDRHQAWPIPARIDEVPLSDHRVLWCGDAAAASDVLTGEGIGQALLSGRLAADAINSGGSDHPSLATSTYRKAIRRELVPDHLMSKRLGQIMSSVNGAERSLAIVHRSGQWGRRNFARWLFEDEPRGILLTPLRWHRRFLARPGAYRNR